MFHRRLILLGVLFLFPVLAASAQLFRLTVVQAGDLKADAERKLVSLDWMPTVRGEVHDRKGRVLAKDRPSYDLAVDYRVLTGAWAETQAGRYARRRYAETWPELSSSQREQLVERYARVYRGHLDRAWDRFAQESGVARDELADRRARIVEQVDRMHSSIAARRWARFTREAIDRRIARQAEAATEIEDVPLEQQAERVLSEEERTAIRRRADRPIRELRVAHALAPRVSDVTAFAFLSLAEQTVTLDELDAEGVQQRWIRVPVIPGLEVRDAGSREYPFERVTVDIDTSTLPTPIVGEGMRSVTVDGVATQILGWMRPRHFAEDADRRSQRLADDSVFAGRALTERGTDRGRYFEGDAVGASGLETALEHDLRGLRGLRVRRLETGTADIIEPAPGQNIALTLDIMLQARVQAAMTPELGLARVQDWHGENNPTMPVGTEIAGGAVVLEIETGEILAMVSTPTFTRHDLRASPESVFEDAVRLPYLDRASAVPYQPGSIVKPLVYCEAVRAGVIDVNEGHVCTGHFLPGRRDVMRCWVYRDRFGLTNHSAMLHGDDLAPLSPAEAIMSSCNIFFYDLGRKLGTDGTAQLYASLGVGSPLGLGIGTEHPGQIGPAGDTDAMQISDAIFLGIGQGPVNWTPVHAAESYAALARGGIRIEPRILRAGAPPAIRELSYTPESIENALAGLDMSINDDRGTGHHITMGLGTEFVRREIIFNCPGVRVWGKTGTAQASPRVADPDGDGPLEPQVVRRGDHSWFVVLVGPESRNEPTHVVAVVMEHAGSGGRVSGPIVNQIVHALRAEGYL